MKEIHQVIFKNVMNVNGGQRVYQDVEITIDHLHNYDPTQSNNSMNNSKRKRVCSFSN
jgi:hypothetical protein